MASTYALAIANLCSNSSESENGATMRRAVTAGLLAGGLVTTVAACGSDGSATSLPAFEDLCLVTEVELEHKTGPVAKGADVAKAVHGVAALPTTKPKDQPKTNTETKSTPTPNKTAGNLQTPSSKKPTTPGQATPSRKPRPGFGATTKGFTPPKFVGKKPAQGVIGLDIDIACLGYDPANPIEFDIKGKPGGWLNGTYNSPEGTQGVRVHSDNLPVEGVFASHTGWVAPTETQIGTFPAATQQAIKSQLARN